jgi:hypothetical protein
MTLLKLSALSNVLESINECDVNDLKVVLLT